MTDSFRGWFCLQQVRAAIRLEPFAKSKPISSARRLLSRTEQQPWGPHPSMCAINPDPWNIGEKHFRSILLQAVRIQCEWNLSHKSYCCTVHFCRISSIINHQLHLHTFHTKHFKNTLNHSYVFRSCQIIIRELCCSLLAKTN